MKGHRATRRLLLGGEAVPFGALLVFGKGLSEHVWEVMTEFQQSSACWGCKGCEYNRLNIYRRLE